MLKKIMLMVAFLILSSLPVHSGDLCLIDINNQSQLKIIQQNVDYAYGRIDNKFITDLSRDQIDILKSARISLEVIAEDIDISRFYMLSEIRPEVVTVPLKLDAVYSSSVSKLVESGVSNFDLFRRSGYMPVSISRHTTPFFYYPTMIPTSSPSRAVSDTLADLVVQDSLLSYDTRLEDFYTRYVLTDSIFMARDWLIGKFQEFGYDSVYTDTFYYYDSPCHNVIALKVGSVEPDKYIVVGGHYDSWNSDSDPNIYAPGADDNGSGTATVLELARIFKDYNSRKSILFTAFSAEEVGLVGSGVMANRLYNQGKDVDFMVNFDMVAYTDDEYDDVAVFTGPITEAYQVFADAALRVTSLSPYFAGNSGNSDHASFAAYGYAVAYAQEGDFNYPGWHTDLDISSRLDFPYFEQLVRMSVAALADIDKAAHLTAISEIWDVGDGQSLRIVWDDCEVDYNYSILYGTASGVYTDTVDVPAGYCTYDLTGLITGVRYYFAILGENSEGYAPLYLLEESGTPYEYPQAPANMSIDLDYMLLDLAWRQNMELDLSHYRLLRREVGQSWEIRDDNVSDTTFTDMALAPHVEYEYRVLAIDDDLNASDSSDVVSGVAPTFDLPLLFVDETASGGSLNPSDSEQAALYGSLFAPYDYDTTSIIGSDLLKRVEAGQYKNIFWFDDDVSTQLFLPSEDSVAWYLEFTTNFCLAGWQTVAWSAGTNQLQSGDLFYDQFGLSKVTDNQNFDFIGATGLNGWPDLETRTDHVFGGLMPSISIFEIQTGAEVLCTFNSNSGDPNFDGYPCGVAYEKLGNKRVVLGFPIYQLTEASSHALIAKIAEYFDLVTYSVYGDANGDSVLNIFDVTYLVAYLYLGGAPPSSLNNGDPNNDCEFNLFDITYLINALYKGGPQPLAGCIE